MSMALGAAGAFAPAQRPGPHRLKRGLEDMFRRVLLGLVLAGVVLALAPIQAAAQVGGLLVTPQMLQFEQSERVKTLRLLNRGTVTQLYRISLINMRQTTDGRTERIDTPISGDSFADEYIRFAPRQIMLPPGEPQTVRFMLRAPGDLPDGEFRSHVLLQQVPRPGSEEEAEAIGSADDELHINITPVFGLSIPIIFHRGEVDFEPRIEASPVEFHEDGTPYLPLRLSSEGNRHMRGNIAVYEDGERIGRLRSVAVYVSTPYRDVRIALDREPAGEIVVEFEDARDGAVRERVTLAYD